MNKKKIIKIVSAILGVVVFIFICNQVDEILDNRRVRLEVEKDRAERQEKKEADQIAEDYMQALVSELQSRLHSSLLHDVQVNYQKISYEKFKDKFGKRDNDADYNYYYVISYTSDSIDQVYSQAKEAGTMTEFLESLKEMGYQKESIFDETYDYETTVNEKTIRVWYLDVGSFEIPIIGTSGLKYEYSRDFMCKHKYLNIDDETVYSEDWISNKEEQKISKNNYSSPSSGSSSSSHSRYHSDPYDVEDYNDPDDFAEEWAEEFGDGNYDDGYDDAYDYWKSERD